MDTLADYDPLDLADAMTRLCRGHVAEYDGVSLDGLAKAEADARADMRDLGYLD